MSELALNVLVNMDRKFLSRRKIFNGIPGGGGFSEGPVPAIDQTVDQGLFVEVGSQQVLPGNMINLAV